MGFLFAAFYHSWLWNLQLRTRSLLRLASMQLIKTSTVVPVLRIWPPFHEPDDVPELQTLFQYIDFYLGPFCPPIEYFTWNKGNSGQTVWRHNGDNNQTIDQVQCTEAQHLCHAARYRVFWRAGQFRRVFLRPFEYVVDDKAKVDTAYEWLRLVNNICANNGAGKPNWFAPPAEHFESCAVVGTGPSSELFRRETDRFKIWIGANSMVLDKELWTKCAPFAICMLDPYLFTPLPYSREIVKSLLCLLNESRSYLLTTAEFAPLLNHLLPTCVQKQCVYVRSIGPDGFRLRLRAHKDKLVVPRFGNVLCDLMLPIASVISKRIVLYGCDGTPDDKSSDNFPKSERFKGMEQSMVSEITRSYSKSFYKREIARIYLHTRYVINACAKNQTAIILRKSSWNKGLSPLPSLE
jgi:hypothetical protein